MMIAKDVMTAPVVTVYADTPVRRIAEVLLAHRISAVPVVDARGAIVGIVSEGDLMRRAETGTERHRSWWLRLVSGPDDLARDYVKAHGRGAADVMTRDVITVAEDSPVSAIACLLEERRIKRVPVVRDGRLVGIVSRADLLRGLATQPAPPEPSVSMDDRAIRDRLMRTLGEVGWTRPEFVKVIVTDGVVHLWGLVSSKEQRRALVVAAGNVPGARGVEDHMTLMPPTLWAE
jgi:CBS domain-containing protein